MCFNGLHSSEIAAKSRSRVFPFSNRWMKGSVVKMCVFKLRWSLYFYPSGMVEVWFIYSAEMGFMGKINEENPR